MKIVKDLRPIFYVDFECDADAVIALVKAKNKSRACRRAAMVV